MATRKIYSYTSNNIYCEYSLSISRSGSTISITAAGTIYGNGSSSDSNSDLYAHVCYNVSPANTGTGTTYVTSYGTSLGGKKVVSKPLNSSSIPTSGKSFSQTWTITNNNAVTYSNCALFLSNSSTSASSAPGAYGFIGKKDSSLNVNNLRYYTEPLSIDAGYTACTAPTTVSRSSAAIVKPDAVDVTISWSGASGGTNNSITGYKLYYRRGSQPTLDTYDGTRTITTTSTSSSYTFEDFSSDTYRGVTYYFKIQTIGTVSGYHSSISSKSTNVTVNSLPSKPTVTIVSGTTTVGSSLYRSLDSSTSSGYADIKMNFSATDSESSQTITYRYALSAVTPTTSNTYACSSDTNFRPTSDKTYYFWSYDGLEFSSSYVTKTIKFGAELTGSMGATTSATTHSRNGTSYITGGTNKINYTSSGVGTKTYVWKLMYGSSSSSLDGTQTCSWNYQGSFGWNKSYYIKCTVTDQLGQTFTTRYPAAGSEYQIPTKPVLNSIFYNQLGTDINTKPSGNVANSNSSDFYQTVVTYLSASDTSSAAIVKDTSITLAFSISPSATVNWYTDASNSTFGQSGIIPLKITKATDTTTYTLTITPTCQWGGALSAQTYTITKTGLPRVSADVRYSASNINNSYPNKIYPFTSTNSYQFVFDKPNIVANNNFIDDTSKNQIQLFLYKDTKDVEIKEDINNSDNRTYIQNTNKIQIYAKQGGENNDSGLYDWKTNVLNLNLNGDNLVGLRIKFRDVFGKDFSIDKPDYFTLSYIQAPTMTLTMNKSLTPSASWISDNILYEGDKLIYSPTINYYNTDNPFIITTYVYRSNSSSSQQGGSWVLYNGTSLINGGTWNDFPNRSSVTTSQLSVTLNYSYDVSEITESTYVFFKTILSYGTSGSSTLETIWSGHLISQCFKVIGNLSAETSFTSPEFKCSTEMNDYGGGLISAPSLGTQAGLNNFAYGMQFSETDDFSSYLWLNTDGTLSSGPSWILTGLPSSNNKYTAGISLSSALEWNYYNVRPVYYAEISDSDHSNLHKYSYGAGSIVYNMSPTISYRKNRIGINTNFADSTEAPYSDAAVIIGATNGGRDQIVLAGPTSTRTIDIISGNLNGFTLDSGALSSYTLSGCSLNSGTITNFVINCGTWDS